MPKKTKSTYNKGQMLLSILISLAIFSILAHALFTLVATTFSLITYNKSRITAKHIALEKMEIIRNLPYEKVATIGGIPNGTLIPQTETINRNGLNYTIKTAIIFIDDPFDGLAPEDLAPEDYKRVRIEVSWEGLSASGKNPIILLSDISRESKGNQSGGTLVILVYDANGNPVPQAQVKIVAESISPPVNLTQTTDSKGKLILPGALECIECYQITVNKSGMSTDKTYSSEEVANPLKPHATVLENQVTQISFTIDKVGSINISSRNSRENNFEALGNVSFILKGGKIIGTDETGKPVYKYDKSLSTDSNGNLNLSNMEWDVYQISMPESTSYDISGTSPLLPIYLSPGSQVDFTFSVDSHTENGFFITVKDPSQNLIASASAKLSKIGEFEEIKDTGTSENPDFGQVFFSNLSKETYNLVVSASGYQNYNSSYDISGYTKAEIVLTPQ